MFKTVDIAIKESWGDHSGDYHPDTIFEGDTFIQVKPIVSENKILPIIRKIEEKAEFQDTLLKETEKELQEAQQTRAMLEAELKDLKKIPHHEIEKEFTKIAGDSPNPYRRWKERQEVINSQISILKGHEVKLSEQKLAINEIKFDLEMEIKSTYWELTTEEKKKFQTTLDPRIQKLIPIGEQFQKWAVANLELMHSYKFVDASLGGGLQREIVAVSTHLFRVYEILQNLKNFNRY